MEVVYKYNRIINGIVLILFTLCIVLFMIDLYLHWRFINVLNRIYPSAEYFANWRDFNWFLHDLLFFSWVFFGAITIFKMFYARRVIITIDFFFLIITLILYFVGVNYMVMYFSL
jgi:hypothetical protein